MADQRRQDPTSENNYDEINGLDNVTDVDIRLADDEDDDDVFDSNWLQWLHALDLHFIGACRADERLTPLFKFNTSPSPLDDRLLSYLTQHFEASEVGLLARWLCFPLVSMRVGKVIKEGTLLCPTSTRGTLKLTLRPSSDLRISFVGDDGQNQTLATLRDVSEACDVAIVEISADQSGRSFLIKVPGGETFYFWCSEKSKLLGIELLHKMKGLLEKKPTLPELTGISESRLDCFATYLRTYLAGSNVDTQANGFGSSAPPLDMRPVTEEPNLSLNTRSSPTSVRHLRFCHNGSQALTGHTEDRGSQSPRSGSYKECFSSTNSSMETASRETLKQHGDPPLPTDDHFMKDAVMKNSGIENRSEASNRSSTSPLSILESLGKCSFPPPSAISQFPPVGSLLSPYYCWCPPFSSPIKPAVFQLPTSTSVEPFTLPPLSSLLPSTGTPVDLADSGLPLELPASLSDPVARLPFSTQSSQQIPTFIPLMCDPIVHIPLLDVCSSGQGYLVNAGPGIATSIPPLHPKLVGSMISEADSLVDKGARETLRLLITSSGSQASATLMNVLPAVLNEDKQGVIVTGSRGLYTGTRDVDAIVHLASLSEIGNLKVSGSGGTPIDDGGQFSIGLDLQDVTSTFMSSQEKKDC